MTQVSKYPIPDIVYKRIFDIFCKSLVKIDTKDEASQFIKDFLTPTEQIMMAKRLAIAFLLDKGYDFRSVHQVLRVSFTTVARVSLMKKYGGKGYQKMIDKLLFEEQVQHFLLKIGEVLTSITKGGPGTGVWRYLNQEIKRKQKAKPF